ncbi:peptidase [Kosakonia sp. MH5]|nr:peptidase [Kosakonia sp. MH5]
MNTPNTQYLCGCVSFSTDDYALNRSDTRDYMLDMIKCRNLDHLLSS